MDIHTDQILFIEEFVSSTREIVYLREADKLMIILPNKIQHLNNTAFEIFDGLYNKKQKPGELIDNLSKKYSLPSGKLVNDILLLIESASAILKDDYSKGRAIRTVPYNPNSIKFPILSEIALTYRCQNRCDFCYASSPYIDGKNPEKTGEMTTEEVKRIIFKIKNQAQVPSMSFTGGEPTLRKDLPELIQYASETGIRVNLITNGIKCADPEYVRRLCDAGLKSAQVSLESHIEDIHNEIVGNKHAFQKTIKGIKNLADRGINVHTNTTICQKNKDNLQDFISFIKDIFNFPYLSMNMIIRTGVARDNENINISYTMMKGLIPQLVDFCEKLQIRFVWYSPTPYCIFNPVDHGLGAKSCAAISGLLSVNPKGEILPCSSFDKGVGSLLKHSFDYIWNSDEALYWREKRYIPPVCSSCKYKALCCGACPLYWEQAGSFREIEDIMTKKPLIKNVIYKLEKSLRVRSRGISGKVKRR